MKSLRTIPLKWLASLIVFIFSFSLWTEAADLIRKPAVSGQFYPADKAALQKMIRQLLQGPAEENSGAVRAVIVPHAAYVFSGNIAAEAYKRLTPQRDSIRTVFLISSNHHFTFDGISVYGTGGFQTPLGSVPIDEIKAKQLTDFSEKIQQRPQDFDQDHTIEVQLPFLQSVLADFKIVPILFGNDDPTLASLLAEALSTITDDNTLIVASSDLSHYPSSSDANIADFKTVQSILSNNPNKLQSTNEFLSHAGVPQAVTFACGIQAIQTVMTWSNQTSNLKPIFLKYDNSGSISGDSSRVVGYASIIYVAQEGEKMQEPMVPQLGEDDKKSLLSLARRTVEHYTLMHQYPEVKIIQPSLNLRQGAFVTLKKNGALRGCIGRFESDVPLYQTVMNMAVAAAFHDGRFDPVTPDELSHLKYEISVLSPLQKIQDPSLIIPGKHGVQIQKGHHGGVFLPQVAIEHNWDRETLLSVLCKHKAGLEPDCWKDPSAVISIFTAEVFEEDDTRL